MNSVPRKKSPRAPSVALDDAIDKAGKIYDKDRCHAAPLDGVAQHIGYKSSGNGAALSTLASLKYYGLLDRPKEGMAAVSKEYESFRVAPNDAIKRELITKWLKAPPVFAELLDKYPESLPSDATIKFDLIQKGFAPAAADVCLLVFRKSVDFARYFEQIEQSAPELADESAEPAGVDETYGNTIATPLIQPNVAVSASPASFQAAVATPLPPLQQATTMSDSVDRIPVRLAGGRRAWIEIPMPFYEADKDRLKKQIDLLITDDEESINDLL